MRELELISVVGQGATFHTLEPAKASPQVTVTLSLPLLPNVPYKMALAMLGNKVKNRIANGQCRPVACVSGWMKGRSQISQYSTLILLYGSFNDGDDPCYYVRHVSADRLYLAILLNADGTRSSIHEPLPPKVALGKWMARFLSQGVGGLDCALVDLAKV